VKSNGEDTIQASLTVENLRQFDRLEQQKNAEESGFCSEPKSMSCRATGSATLKAPDSETWIVSPEFDLQTRKNGVLSRFHSEHASNRDELIARMNRGRNSPPPSESEFNTYTQRLQAGGNKQALAVAVTELLKNDVGGEYENYLRARHARFELQKYSQLSNVLEPPMPDITEGLSSEAFYPFDVCHQLHQSCPLTMNGDVPGISLAHFTGVLNDPTKGLAAVHTKNAYAAATLVKARDEATEYLGDPDPSGHAAVLSFATDGRQVEFYASHSTAGERRQYHVTRLGAADLVSSRRHFALARRLLRNVQEDAMLASCALRDRLLGAWTVRFTAAQWGTGSEEGGDGDHGMTPEEARRAEFKRTMADIEDALRLLAQKSTAEMPLDLGGVAAALRAYGGGDPAGFVLGILRAMLDGNDVPAPEPERGGGGEREAEARDGVVEVQMELETRANDEEWGDAEALWQG
jgi:hypothetical protein